MSFEIKREDRKSLVAYATVPIAFEVRTVVDTRTLQVGRSDFATRSVAPARTKNYDSYPGNDPASWAHRFAIDDWLFLTAYDERGERVGGAVVVMDDAGIVGVGGRPAFAVLWDLRVSPSVRRHGVGRLLLSAAEAAAREAGLRGLDAETQDTNAPACRLYASSGFALTAIIPAAYEGVPTETKLVWTKQFATRSRVP